MPIDPDEPSILALAATLDLPPEFDPPGGGEPRPPPIPADNDNEPADAVAA
jgi:hypothetical protein